MKTITLSILLTIVAMIAAACQSPSSNNTNQARPAATPANAASSNSQPEKPANSAPANEAKSAVETSPADLASTPTEAYKAAYAARKNKDTKALRRLIAKDMFEFLEIMGGDGPDAIENGLKEMVSQPQGSSDQSRNEKITGNTATLEYLDKDDKWKTLDFVKEDGGWKLTIAKPKPGDVKVER